MRTEVEVGLKYVDPWMKYEAVNNVCLLSQSGYRTTKSKSMSPNCNRQHQHAASAVLQSITMQVWKALGLDPNFTYLFCIVLCPMYYGAGARAMCLKSKFEWIFVFHFTHERDLFSSPNSVPLILLKKKSSQTGLIPLKDGIDFITLFLRLSHLALN